jgi:predicted RNase H-like HicB family nuclease
MPSAKRNSHRRSIHAVFQNDGKWFIARRIDYPVTTQGKTFAAAKKNLQEAVELYLETWGDSAAVDPESEIYFTSLAINA